MSPVKRFSGFALVGASGVLVNVAVMWLLHAVGVNYLIAAVISTQVAIAWNLLLSELIVFRDRREHMVLGHRVWRYFLINNLDTVVRIPLLFVLVDGLGMRPSPANLLLIVAASVVKYAVVGRFVYRPVAVAIESSLV